MNQFLAVLIVFLVSSSAFTQVSSEASHQATSTKSPETKTEYHQNTIIIKFKPERSVKVVRSETDIMLAGIQVIDELNIKYKCIEMERLFPIGNKQNDNYNKLGLGDVYKLVFSDSVNITELIEQYIKTGEVEFAEPDFIGEGSGKSVIPNDQYFFRQWSLKNDGTFPPSHAGTVDADIDMDEAWDIEQGDSSIIIGILDSGAKLDHPELSDRIWRNYNETDADGIDNDGNGFVDDIRGWDFAFNDNDPSDGHGHGTNVTGIIGAAGNNNIGYAGVDWKSKLMICKILDDDNLGFYSWWASAIYYAVDQGANVLNMSVGGVSFSSSLELAVNYAYQNDVTIVVSMMNNNNDVPYYPAAYANSIAVGATDTDDSRVNPFFWGGGSSYGAHIDVVAPGNYIYGLNHLSDTEYGWYWGGTSQAAPHVTGLVALLLAQDSSRTVEEIRTIISETAEDQVGDPAEDSFGFDQYYGYGRINAYLALKYNPVISLFDIKITPIYAVPGGGIVIINASVISDTVEFRLFAEFESPDNMPIDTLELFDDGAHNDASDGDGVFGNAWSVPENEERLYIVDLHVTSADTLNMEIDNVGLFTSIGPVSYDSHEIVLNNGSILFFDLNLINLGVSSTASNIVAEISTVDSCVTNVNFGINSFGDIAAGATEKSSARYSIDLNQNCVGDELLTFDLAVSSDNVIFWSDNFEIQLEPIGVDEIARLPSEHALSEAYPNPFNPTTTIEYSLPMSGEVSLKVYNLLGQEVANLVSGEIEAGYYSARWNASDVSSGIYFYRLRSGDFVRTRKMLLLK